MAQFCSECGNPIGEGARFCTKCGYPVDEPTPAPKTEKPKAQKQPPEVKVAKAVSTSAVKKAVAVFSGTTIAASPVAGEVAFGASAISSATNILDPFKTILGGFKRIFASFKNALQNKKGLIAAIILAVVWILLTLLPMLGFNPLPVKLLSWLTFAKGGLKGGIFGFIGGVLGKGMFATLLISLITGGKKTFAEIKNAPARIKSAFKGASLSMTLIGIGAALVLFNLMAGISCPIQSMAGISGCLLSLKALGGEGFIHRLATSVTANKIGNIRTENTAKCTALVSGLSLGFATGTVISLIPWGYLPFFLGVATIAAGVIMGIVLANKKEVAAQ